MVKTAKIFSDIHSRASRTSRQKSIQWFRKRAREVRSTRVAPNEYLKNSKQTSSGRTGRMYLFQYFPKYHKELPYWDKFPLIFYMPHRDGKKFSGINIHYLPPILRAKLMDALYDTAMNLEEFNRNTYLNITYGILKSASKYKEFKPTYKLYLRSKMKSRFLYIPPKNWDIALMLPLARFHKTTTSSLKPKRKPKTFKLKNDGGSLRHQVYRDSRAIIAKP